MSTELDDLLDVEEEEDAYTASADAGEDEDESSGTDVLNDDEGLQSAKDALAYGDDEAAKRAASDDLNKQVDAILNRDPHAVTDPEPDNIYAEAGAKVGQFSEQEMQGFLSKLSDANAELRAQYADEGSTGPNGPDEPVERFDPHTLDRAGFNSFIKAVQGGPNAMDIPAGFTWDTWVRAIDSAQGR